MDGAERKIQALEDKIRSLEERLGDEMTAKRKLREDNMALKTSKRKLQDGIIALETTARKLLAENAALKIRDRSCEDDNSDEFLDYDGEADTRQLINQINDTARKLGEIRPKIEAARKELRSK